MSAPKHRKAQPRPILAAQAAALHAEGLSGLKIAKQLHISRSYAYDLLADPDGSALRERKKHAYHYGQCIDCGAEVRHQRPTLVPRRCHICHAAHRSAYFADEYAAQREAIVDMWHEGLSLREIAARLGMAPGVLCTAMHRLRHDYGYDLPYRYAMRGGKRVPA